MSRQVETGFESALIDSREFAREGRRLTGELPVAALGRVAELLADNTGSLQCEVHGEHDDDGVDFLCLAVSGVLQLRCQRCLENMVFALRLKSRLRLVSVGGEWPDDALEDDASDNIAADMRLALLPLIEEEVLLGLPLAPRHEFCEPPASLDQERRPSAFASLAQLKKH